MRRLTPALFVLIATPAFAHDGHHEGMAAMQALGHALSATDHQLALAALVVLAVTGGWFWRRATAGR